jgi:hypothetical protein
MVELHTRWSYFILYVFVPDDGRNMEYKIKSNKLIKAYLTDLWNDSCVDWSTFEKVIRQNRMQISTMYDNL